MRFHELEAQSIHTATWNILIALQNLGNRMEQAERTTELADLFISHMSNMGLRTKGTFVHLQANWNM